MKHETTTLLIKNKMAESLRKFMNKKPLNKITVTEIVNDCGINRKTFYYHFMDIYDLAEWMFGIEEKRVLENTDLLVEYIDVLRYTFLYIKQNRTFCYSALNGVGVEKLREFLVGNLVETVKKIIESKTETTDAGEDYINFLVAYHIDAIAQTYLSWMKNGMKEDTEKLIGYLRRTLECGIKAALYEK